MYTSQAVSESFNPLTPPLLLLIAIGLIIIIVNFIFFIKMWNACTDIWKIRRILEDSLPLAEEKPVEEPKKPLDSF